MKDVNPFLRTFDFDAHDAGGNMATTAAQSIQLPHHLYPSLQQNIQLPHPHHHYQQQLSQTSQPPFHHLHAFHQPHQLQLHAHAHHSLSGGMGAANINTGAGQELPGTLPGLGMNMGGGFGPGNMALTTAHHAQNAMAVKEMFKKAAKPIFRFGASGNNGNNGNNGNIGNNNSSANTAPNATSTANNIATGGGVALGHTTFNLASVPTLTPLQSLGGAVPDQHIQAVEELKYFLATGPSNWEAGQMFKKYVMANGEPVTCVLWNNLFYITGTDIVRCVSFRFQAVGRSISNAKKFEEGIFSDLRNLKSGVDATLEEPRSPFLEVLYRNGCVRTQKKQKVFYWYSVPHDRLFMDALERELRRDQETTSGNSSGNGNGSGVTNLSSNAASKPAANSAGVSSSNNNKNNNNNNSNNDNNDVDSTSTERGGKKMSVSMGSGVDANRTSGGILNSNTVVSQTSSSPASSSSGSDDSGPSGAVVDDSASTTFLKSSGFASAGAPPADANQIPSRSATPASAAAAAAAAAAATAGQATSSGSPFFQLPYNRMNSINIPRVTPDNISPLSVGESLALSSHIGPNNVPGQHAFNLMSPYSGNAAAASATGTVIFNQGIGSANEALGRFASHGTDVLGAGESDVLASFSVAMDGNSNGGHRFYSHVHQQQQQQQQNQNSFELQNYLASVPVSGGTSAVASAVASPQQHRHHHHQQHQNQNHHQNTFQHLQQTQGVGYPGGRKFSLDIKPERVGNAIFHGTYPGRSSSISVDSSKDAEWRPSFLPGTMLSSPLSSAAISMDESVGNNRADMLAHSYGNSFGGGMSLQDSKNSESGSAFFEFDIAAAPLSAPSSHHHASDASANEENSAEANQEGNLSSTLPPQFSASFSSLLKSTDDHASSLSSSPNTLAASVSNISQLPPFSSNAAYFRSDEKQTRGSQSSDVHSRMSFSINATTVSNHADRFHLNDSMVPSVSPFQSNHSVVTFDEPSASSSSSTSSSSSSSSSSTSSSSSSSTFPTLSNDANRLGSVEEDVDGSNKTTSGNKNTNSVTGRKRTLTVAATDFGMNSKQLHHSGSGISLQDLLAPRNQESSSNSTLSSDASSSASSSISLANIINNREQGVESPHHRNVLRRVSMGDESNTRGEVDFPYSSQVYHHEHHQHHSALATVDEVPNIGASNQDSKIRKSELSRRHHRALTISHADRTGRCPEDGCGRLLSLPMGCPAHGMLSPTRRSRTMSNPLAVKSLISQSPRRRSISAVQSPSLHHALQLQPLHSAASGETAHSVPEFAIGGVVSPMDESREVSQTYSSTFEQKQQQQQQHHQHHMQQGQSTDQALHSDHGNQFKGFNNQRYTHQPHTISTLSTSFSAVPNSPPSTGLEEFEQDRHLAFGEDLDMTGVVF